MTRNRWIAAGAAAAVALATAAGILTTDQAQQALVWIARIAGVSP